MIFLHASLWALVMPLIVLDMLSMVVTAQQVPVNTKDPHGGVPMGISNAVCDDAQANVELDWNPNSSEEFTCTEGTHKNYEVGLHYSHCDKYAAQPLHICYPRTINYTEDLPTSGSHRPLWPKYGEYSYVPPQRWLHNLEHGAIVFLYHPCASPDQIQLFKAIAKNCLRRHIISPYKKMPPDMNFALLSWKCKLVLSNVNMSLMVQFIKTRALHGPEQVAHNGQYSIGLIQNATIVSDISDSQLCPSMSMMSETVKEFKDRSFARRTKSRQSQDYLAHIMRSFISGFTK